MPKMHCFFAIKVLDFIYINWYNIVISYVIFLTLKGVTIIIGISSSVCDKTSYIIRMAIARRQPVVRIMN